MASRRGAMSRSASPHVPSAARPAGAGGLEGAWVVAITILAFLPVVRNGFVNWDDDATLVGNPHFRGLTAASLTWMFTTFHMGHYQPLSWLSFAVNFELGGLSPPVYHLTNLGLHALNALLVYRLALWLLPAALGDGKGLPPRALRLGAAGGALLFSVHPQRVESVAWATQRRDVLSAAFVLGCFLWYLRAAGAARGRRGIAMGLALGLATLATLSKAVGVVIPGALLLLDVYPLRRLSWHPATGWSPRARVVLAEKLPFLALAVAGGLVAVRAQADAGALVGEDVLGPASRINVAVRALALSVAHMLLPRHLAPLYELPATALTRVDGAFRVVVDGGFLAGAALFLGVSGASVALLRRAPALGAAWAWLLLFMLPVSGVFQSGPQLTADRYTYLASVGVSLVAGGLAAREAAQGGRRRRRALASVGVVIAVLGVATARQVRAWRDSGSLWSAAVAHQPRNARAHLMLGSVHFQAGDLRRAEDAYRRAVELWPESVNALYLLSVTLARRGAVAEAETWARAALRVEPDHGPSRRLLAEIAGAGPAHAGVPRAP